MGLVIGIILTIFVVAALVYALAPWLVRPGWWLVLSPRYSFVVRGAENVPSEGPGLLVSNHVTWIDGFVLAAVTPRRVRYLVNADYINMPVIRSIAWRLGMLPLPATGPKAQRQAIQAARARLDRGEMLGIFAEGQLSRNGLTGSFRRGLEAVMGDREDLVVVPVFIDNLWGSVFSFQGGGFFSHRPRGIRHRVGIVFGPPLRPPLTAAAVRQAVIEAGVHAFDLRNRTDRDRPLETLDPALPGLTHEILGCLTGSSADYHRADVHQVGRKAGSVGHPLPGVAIRVVDEEGRQVGPDREGRLQVLKAGMSEWLDLAASGRVDKDGFVFLRVGEGTGPAA